MGWLRRVLRGGWYDDRDRRDRLVRYQRACERLAVFLREHGDERAAVDAQERVSRAARLLRDGWTREDLLALAVPMRAPWPSGKGRDFGAEAPEYADDGDRLYGAVNEVGLALRAVGDAGGHVRGQRKVGGHR